jgi:hypothetical protein
VNRSELGSSNSRAGRSWDIHTDVKQVPKRVTVFPVVEEQLDRLSAFGNGLFQSLYWYTIGLHTLQKPAVSGDDFRPGVASHFDKAIGRKQNGVICFAVPCQICDINWRPNKLTWDPSSKNSHPGPGTCDGRLRALVLH